MNEKTKKGIKIISIIAIIIAIIIIMALFILNNKHSKIYMYNIFYKNMLHTNYIVKIEKKSGTSDVSDVSIITSKDKVYKEENLTTNTTKWSTGDFFINEQQKIKIPSNSLQYPLANYFDIYPYLSLDSYKYKYIGKEIYDNKKCDIVQFTTDMENQTDKLVKFWIDADTKFVLKKEVYNDKAEKIEEKKFEIKLDVVSDNDLILPDTADYINPKELQNKID